MPLSSACTSKAFGANVSELYTSLNKKYKGKKSKEKIRSMAVAGAGEKWRRHCRGYGPPRKTSKTKKAEFARIVTLLVKSGKVNEAKQVLRILAEDAPWESENKSTSRSSRPPPIPSEAKKPEQDEVEVPYRHNEMIKRLRNVMNAVKAVGSVTKKAPQDKISGAPFYKLVENATKILETVYKALQKAAA